MSTIPLAKGYKPEKLHFPVHVSHKIDGVPVRIDISENGGWTVVSRQGKGVPSVHNLVSVFVEDYMRACRMPIPVSIVGEVCQRGNPNADFKDTSGIVRRQEDQSHLLEIWLFDCSAEGNFYQRKTHMEEWFPCGKFVNTVYQKICFTEEELDLAQAKFMFANPDAEGMIVRSHNDPWCPGKRSWGYQKLLNEPTIDLRIVGVDEAIDQYGEPKGMAGRLVASYKGEEIGIGPGKLTHKERVYLWQNYAASGDLGIAQIKYKKDGSYKALRQPTFQYWRKDKETPDA